MIINVYAASSWIPDKPLAFRYDRKGGGIADVK